ncbi:MAG: guanylate kinase [Pirellulales bacterium]
MTGTAPGRLIVISGPSGSGKSTLVREVLSRYPGQLELSISATTRAPRAGEREGVDYQFLSQEEFARRREQGDFLECFEVYEGGHWYGTLWSAVAPSLAAGKSVVLEIDVQGTLAVLERYPDALTIFVEPGSLDELERRLRRRGTESEQSIERRLAGAKREMAFAGRYRYRIVNDDLEAAIAALCRILTQNPEAPSCSKT